MAVPSFVDRVTLHVWRAGGGTAWRRCTGRSSSRSAARTAAAGPGPATPRPHPAVTTLIDYHQSPRRRASHGGHGAGYKSGARGVDLVLPVPDGTLVRDRSGTVLADMVGARAPSSRVAALRRLGAGGNVRFLASARRKAPGFALLGEPGEER